MCLRASPADDTLKTPGPGNYGTLRGDGGPPVTTAPARSASPPGAGGRAVAVLMAGDVVPRPDSSLSSLGLKAPVSEPADHIARPFSTGSRSLSTMSRSTPAGGDAGRYIPGRKASVFGNLLPTAPVAVRRTATFACCRVRSARSLPAQLGTLPPWGERPGDGVRFACATFACATSPGARASMRKGRARLQLPPRPLGEEATRCSRGSPTGRGGLWSWLRKRPGCSTTTTSAPSTSCSASSTRARAWPPRPWSRWASARRPCASRSRRSSARASRRPPATSPSLRAPRRCSSSRCARRCSSGTTTSAPSTSCSA